MGFAADGILAKHSLRNWKHMLELRFDQRAIVVKEI
jgi:hypothetical protein